MNKWADVITKFIEQAKSGDLKTASYPKEWLDLKMKVSFGMGAPARIPWIALTAPEMQVSKGIYPGYLYYKDLDTLVLVYGISETAEFGKSWPAEIMGACQTVEAFFNRDVPRYGDSFVFKAYKVNPDLSLKYYNDDSDVSEKDLQADLDTIVEYYKQTIIGTPSLTPIEYSQGLFYMEKQLEDFIIHNWANTELGKKFDLIIEDGELLSQQYRTEIGPIDILARDKQTNDYVVIELKKNQTSDDTVGQLARYMGWIKDVKKNANVKGIIIAGSYDKKLDFALKIMQNVEVFLYQVDFNLREFKKN